jgi:hypothetical protein
MPRSYQAGAQHAAPRLGNYYALAVNQRDSKKPQGFRDFAVRSITSNKQAES